MPKGNILLGNKPSGMLMPSKKLIASVQADKAKEKPVSDKETEMERFKRFLDEEDDEDQSDGL